MKEIKLKRNPDTFKAHRREGFWQIMFPFTLGIILILGLAVWTIISATQGGDVSLWADISLIHLIIPTMLLSLIPLAILVVLAYGVFQVNKVLPSLAYRVQDVFERIRDIVRKGSDQLVEPYFRLQSWLAALRALFRR